MITKVGTATLYSNGIEIEGWEHDDPDRSVAEKYSPGYLAAIAYAFGKIDQLDTRGLPAFEENTED